jgi:hypothetical protein
MLYVIPDALLKVSLNTNKTGDHVLRNVSYSVEHVGQFYWCLTTFNNVSGITYNMLASFIGV